MTTEQERKEPPPKVRIVDTREPGELRQKLLELGWEQRALECGDYWFFDCIYKKVGIERKEVNDFMASLGDRLANQLERMLDHYDTTILLLEGNWRQVAYDNRIITPRGLTYNTWAQAWNFIRSQQHKGVTIELTVSLGHTVTRLNELYAWYQKTTHTGGMSHMTFQDDRIMAFPRGSRGKTAQLILDEFKTLADIATASPNDLMRIKGVGDKKALAIYEHFNNERENKIKPMASGLGQKTEDLIKQKVKEYTEGQGRLQL